MTPDELAAIRARDANMDPARPRGEGVAAIADRRALLSDMAYSMPAVRNTMTLDLWMALGHDVAEWTEWTADAWADLIAEVRQLRSAFEESMEELRSWESSAEMALINGAGMERARIRAGVETLGLVEPNEPDHPGPWYDGWYDALESVEGVVEGQRRGGHAITIYGWDENGAPLWRDSWRR